MARKYNNGYEDITIEARQADGKWCVRNSFTHQNEAVMSGSKPREWLVRMATSMMFDWRSFDDKPLRVTGTPKYVGGYNAGQKD